MENITKMTAEEFVEFEDQLKNVFDIVRVLDENLINQVTIDEAHKNAISSVPVECYAFWGKHQRCENCISAKVLMDMKQRTKLEILDSRVYQVFSKYIEIDGKPCAVEMLSLMHDDSIVDSHGRDKLIDMLSHYKKELYTDALTGCYNRRYYEDELKSGHMNANIAMMDVDRFKDCNDSFGHDAGDLALKAIVDITTQNIRKTDFLVRFGGDEFLLVFLEMPAEAFKKKLDSIRQQINETTVLGYKDMKLSVSIGGVIADTGKTIEENLQQADKQLYIAKKHKNTVAVKDADA